MSDQVRVIMWTLPRSRSSMVTKCMDRVPDSKIFFQVYTTPYRAGLGEVMSSPRSDPHSEESDDLADEPASSGYPDAVNTYQWTKKQLEADYPGKRFIFSKEMAMCLDGKFEYLPKGYRHIFLIRHPISVFKSFKKCLPELLANRGQYIPMVEEGNIEMDKQPLTVLSPGLAFKDVVDLYEYLKEMNIEPHPIIVDSDDLTNDPAAFLAAIFKRLGVQYHDSLLHWEKGADVMDRWVIGAALKKRITTVSYYNNFLDSTGFIKPKSGTQDTFPGENLAEDVQRCVDFTMPYYMKLYENRLTV